MIRTERAKRSPATNDFEKDRPRQILLAAARAFGQRGYHGATIQDIASAVGLQKGSLYHHIRSKQDLLREMVNLGIDGVTAGLEEILALELAPDQELHRAVENHVLVLIQNLDFVRVFLKERHALTPESAETYVHKRGRYEQLFQSTIRRGMDAGLFRPDNARLTTFAILGMINSVANWYVPGGLLDSQNIAAYYANLVDRMVR